MEKITWTDRVRNEEVLHRVKDERDVLHTVKRRKGNWTGHTLRRNCLLKHITERNIGGTEVAGRLGSIRMQLLNELKKTGGYCKLKEEALYRTVWRTDFGRGYGLVVRQTTE